MTTITTVLGALMASAAYVVRKRADKRPASVKKIVLPPVFMSSGFLMFLFPYFYVPPVEALEAFLVGMTFSFLLIKTSSFEVKGREIYLKRSKAFAFILIGLLLFRLAMKMILGQYIPFGETSGLFFILAFGMILPWRLGMYVKYKKIGKVVHAAEESA